MTRKAPVSCKTKGRNVFRTASQNLFRKAGVFYDIYRFCATEIGRFWLVSSHHMAKLYITTTRTKHYSVNLG